MLYPPPQWTNAPLWLYHGTVDVSAKAIVSSGVNIGAGRTRTNFGLGFYTTTLERQAQTWAYQQAERRAGFRPAVVRIEISRDALAALDVLTFVRGDHDAEDFWSFVVHCRSGGIGHSRAGSPHFYDVVAGPVASFWQQRLLIQGVDQVSFHTAAAESVLNASTRSL